MGLLQDAGLDQIYLTDIHGLNPLLDAMGQRGMPVNADRRMEAAQMLEQERAATLATIRALIPAACCPTKRYRRRPVTDLPVTVTAIPVMTKLCTYCGKAKPNKKHTCWKDKQPQISFRTDQIEVWAVQLPFVVSPKGLLTYFKYKGYTIPKKYDRATGQRRDTTDEGALLRMALSHEDQVLALVLQFRDVDKQLSTYVGRPSSD